MSKSDKPKGAKLTINGHEIDADNILITNLPPVAAEEIKAAGSLYKFLDNTQEVNFMIEMEAIGIFEHSFFADRDLEIIYVRGGKWNRFIYWIATHLNNYIKSRTRGIRGKVK